MAEGSELTAPSTTCQAPAFWGVQVELLKTRYKNGAPEPGNQLKKAAAAISGWDRPLLTFIYPGFDCHSAGLLKQDPCPVIHGKSKETMLFWAYKDY